MTIGIEQEPMNELVLFSMPLLLHEANIDHTEDTSFSKNLHHHIFLVKNPNYYITLISPCQFCLSILMILYKKYHIQILIILF
jgi:hypothetical protein